MNDTAGLAAKTFQLEEATIAGLHEAIRDGRTTVTDGVQRYLARVRAYNGVASVLGTPEGRAGAEANGGVRAGEPLRVRADAAKASTIRPELAKAHSPP